MTQKNRFELDPERLATTDKEGNRIYLYPEDVEGKWKDRRTLFYWFLILLYLILPWVYINDKPSLMLNIFTREFTFMGFTLHGVETHSLFLNCHLTSFFSSPFSPASLEESGVDGPVPKQFLSTVCFQN
jgi:hypothetical protein